MIGEIELLFDVIDKDDREILAIALREKPEFAHARGGHLGWTLLHQAAHSGRLEIARMLLDASADVHARDKAERATPLHLAAGGGHLDLTMLLVTHGADVNDDDDALGVGPIGWATLAKYHPKVADFLASSGARIGFFPAIAMNRRDVVEQLVESDATWLDASFGPFVPFGRPLHFAASRGRVRIVDTLVQLGADPNERDWLGLTPLAVAAFRRRDDVVAKLEARGARIDLGAAIALGHFDEASQLLHGSAEAIRPGGTYERLLHFTAQEGHLEAARFLLDAGALVDERLEWWPGHKLAPLHLAASSGHIELVRLFAHRGADLLIEDSRYKSAPRGWAIEHRRPEIVTLLRELEPEI